MDIDHANLFNLTSLWKKYGAKEFTKNTNVLAADSNALYCNNLWPRKAWFENNIPTNDFAWLNSLPNDVTLPIWPVSGAEKFIDPAELSLIDDQLGVNSWYTKMEQTAMYLPMGKVEDHTQVSQYSDKEDLLLRTVDNYEEATTWIDVVASAFGYVIDQQVVDGLLGDSQIKVLNAYDNGEAIASALLYKTESTIGIHQIGVVQGQQGKGYARKLMRQLLTMCKQWQGDNIVLQASTAGKPLYESLGFETQFIIKSYKKHKANFKK